MSYVSIRNVEILDDFEKYLRKKKNSLSECPDEFSKIQKVIRNIKNYEMMTYDPGEEANSRFSVNFKFFEEIENIFKEYGAKEIFDDIYNSAVNEKMTEMFDTAFENMLKEMIGRKGRTARNIIKKYLKIDKNNHEQMRILMKNCPDGIMIKDLNEALKIFNAVVDELYELN